MDALVLARWQFAVTTVYHFFFVPITLGLSIFVAILETAYVRTDNPVYLRMTKFWGKLFLINFAIGVATGIVQEFQFGMNWSQYSRFMGDIFGAPLAIEALLAFYMESTFLGLWIFGWEKLSKKTHAAMIWLVAIGSNLSAIWILAANSFMQEPVGYVLRNGRAEMVNFFALIGNPNLWVQFPHVFTGALTSAGFLVVGISAYHLLKKSNDQEAYQKSMKYGFIFALVGSVLVVLLGHTQMQRMVKVQPMKVAAAEALWNTEKPASLSLFTIGDEVNRKDIFSIRIPALLSILSYDRVDAEVKGINEIQSEYEQKYGPGDYVPSVIMSYWMFRFMVGVGILMLILAIYGVIKMARDKLDFKPGMLKILIWSMFLPLIGHSTGWIFAEMGRQPWSVFGLFKTEAGVSNAVSGGAVLFSFIGYIVIYLLLIIAEVFLFKKYAVAGTQALTTKE